MKVVPIGAAIASPKKISFFITRLCVSRPLPNAQCDLGSKRRIFLTALVLLKSHRHPALFQTPQLAFLLRLFWHCVPSAFKRLAIGTQKEERRVCLHAPLGRMCWCVLKFADVAAHSSRRTSAKLLLKVHMPIRDTGLHLRFTRLLSAALRTKDSSFMNVISILGASVGAPMNNGWGSL